MNYASKIASVAKPLIEMKMYRPMLVTLINEFVDLHRTARFLISICKRYDTATCTAALYVKQLHDVTNVFEQGFNVQLKKLKLTAAVNTAMQLGMTYDYILYLNVLISRLQTILHHLQSYILYTLVLKVNGKEKVLSKVQQLDEKCAAELQTEWKKVVALTEADYNIRFRDGLSAVAAEIHSKTKVKNISPQKRVSSSFISI